MNFDLFCNKQEKKLVTAITFAYDVEITRFICQKKNVRKIRVRIHRGLPGQQFTDSSNSKRKKKLFQTDDFSQQNQKKGKNLKNLKNKKFKKSKKRHRNV